MFKHCLKRGHVSENKHVWLQQLQDIHNPFYAVIQQNSVPLASWLKLTVTQVFCFNCGF